MSCPALPSRVLLPAVFFPPLGSFGWLVVVVFLPFNRHPLRGDPTEDNQASACVRVAFYGPHTSSLFSHFHLDACSAASMLLLIALLRFAPVIPTIISFAEGMTCKPSETHLHWHASGFPPIPTAGLLQFLILSPLSLLCLFHPLLIPLTPVKLTVLWTPRPGWRLSMVWVMCAGIFSCLFRSTVNDQSRAVKSKPTKSFFLIDCSPFLTNVIILVVTLTFLLSPIPLIASAMALRTWSCLQRYWPSPGAQEQLLSICSRVPVLEYRGHDGVSTLPQTNKLSGLGRMSYTPWIKNLILCGFHFHMSCQVTFRSIACSHFIQAPCFFIPTILLAHSSSIEARTSSCTNLHLSFSLEVL